LPQDGGVAGEVTRAVRAAVRKAFGSSAAAQGRDVDAVRLALLYAAALDHDGEPCDRCGSPPPDLVKLGPLLLAVLESLCLTPRGRSAAAAAVPPGAKPVCPVDVLRAERERRAAGGDG
jgi:hypothetical protein